MHIFKHFVVVLALVSVLIIPTKPAMAEEPVHPGYPFVFDMSGKIERISDEMIVIEDDLFKISTQTTYHAPDTIFTTPSLFQDGDVVGLVLKNKKTREILSIWLIKKAD